jgi:tetratricopeptide (TPR) repeat protein
MKLGKYPEAAEDHSRALERSPDADLYQHRGWAHFFADAWKLALRDFTRAIELAPEAGDACTGRGLARVMLGDHRGAVADAEAALRRKPSTPEMMYNVACIFAQAAARTEAEQGDERWALVQDYRGRAVASLRQALGMLRPAERSSFWRDTVRADAALAPIRNDARFQRLQEECGEPESSRDRGHGPW